LLLECRIAAYGSARYQDQPQGHSYALAPIVAANGMEKTGRGDLAPRWWQDGDKARVIAYCCNDVRIERAALRLGLAGQLKNPNTGELFKLRPLEPQIYPELYIV
jgi:hypothetical protein